MNRLELIKELQAEFAHVFCVAQVALQAARKAARSCEHRPSPFAVAMRLLSRKSLFRDFVGQAFADAHSRDGKVAYVQVAAERDENDSRNSHYVGAVRANAISLHA